ncbi:Monothiol glutaredoxin-S9 [Ranunculus cassubicifolius]
MDAIRRLTAGKGVVILSKSTCCMCYTVKVLFNELGVNPMVHELDQTPEGREIEKALMRLGCSTAVPAVYVGGTLIGSTNEIMTLHLAGSLVPLVRPYQTFM